jgi:transcriptional regulator with XRE-family HTH domain
VRIKRVEDFGAIARQRRRDLGLSQAQVAERAGVTRQWLVGFEKGNSEVSLSKAFAVLRELDLDVRADAAEARATMALVPRSPATSFNIPKINLPHLNMDELRRSLNRYGTDDPLAAVRARIARIDAARHGADQADDA